MEKIYKAILVVLCLFCGKMYSQCSTAANTPYHEDFGNVTVNGQLPTCWAVSNATTCSTFAGPGSKFATFSNAPAGDDYFYTDAIQLYAGITYSTSLWYILSGTFSQVAWTDLSILLGTNQSSVGLSSIVSSNGNVVNTSTYSALTNTFTVASSGVYYMAIKATSNGVVSGNNLNWDDLSIIVPCTALYNTPSITLSMSSTVVCSGDTVTINALGADTYSWSNGSQGSVYTGVPTFPQSFNVLGTSTLSGCTNTATIFISIKPSPNVAFVVMGSQVFCYGASHNLTAFGANTYTWSNGQQGSTVTVSPTVSTVYSVVGTGTNGCMSKVTHTFDVHPLPVITYTSSAPSATICKGDLVTFTTDVQAGLSHTWSTNNGGAVAVGQGFTLSPVSTVTVYLTGKDQNGCSSTYESQLTVNECASLNEALKESEIQIYPNPGTGTYHIVSGNTELKTIEVSDLAGKIIYSTQSQNNEILLNLNIFDNGVYEVNISSESSRYNYKIIKQ